jgi:hypothetical protein
VERNATGRGITGIIQRYHHHDIVVIIEGNDQQLDGFFDFLQECIDQEMISSFQIDYERDIRRRARRNFSIVTDHSRTADKGGKVIKGPYSDNDHDKESVSSTGSAILLGSQRT